MICGERAAKGLESWALGLAETEEAEAGLKDDAAPTMMQYPKMLVGLRLFAFCSAPSFSSSLFFSLLRNCSNEIREALDGGEVDSNCSEPQTLTRLELENWRWCRERKCRVGNAVNITTGINWN
jgi:hypothetical protein